MAFETPAGTPPGGVKRMTANFGLKDRAVSRAWCGGAHARARRRWRGGRASVQRRRPPRWRPLRGRGTHSDSGGETGSDEEEEDDEEDESSLPVAALRFVGPWLSELMAAEGITTLGQLDAALLQRRSSKAQLAALLSRISRNARRGERLLEDTNGPCPVGRVAQVNRLGLGALLHRAEQAGVPAAFLPSYVEVAALVPPRLDVPPSSDEDGWEEVEE